MTRRVTDGESSASPAATRADLLHPGAGLVVLLGIAVLNVYKPRGLTRYGWRKQREERDRPVRRASAGLPADLAPQLGADRRDD